MTVTLAESFTIAVLVLFVPPQLKPHLHLLYDSAPLLSCCIICHLNLYLLSNLPAPPTPPPAARTAPLLLADTTPARGEEMAKGASAGGFRHMHQPGLHLHVQ